MESELNKAGLLNFGLGLGLSLSLASSAFAEPCELLLQKALIDRTTPKNADDDLAPLIATLRADPKWVSIGKIQGWEIIRRAMIDHEKRALSPVVEGKFNIVVAQPEGRFAITAVDELGDAEVIVPGKFSLDPVDNLQVNALGNGLFEVHFTPQRTDFPDLKVCLTLGVLAHQGGHRRVTFKSSVTLADGTVLTTSRGRRGEKLTVKIVPPASDTSRQPCSLDISSVADKIMHAEFKISAHSEPALWIIEGDDRLYQYDLKDCKVNPVVPDAVPANLVDSLRIVPTTAIRTVRRGNPPTRTDPPSPSNPDTSGQEGVTAPLGTGAE